MSHHKIIFLAAFILLWSSNCSDDEPGVNEFDDNPFILTLNGTWKVISFEDFRDGTKEFKTEENSWGRDIVVTFDDTSNPHEVSGTNITNSIFGEFDYAGKRSFEIGNLGSTYVGQPEWADKFLEGVLDGVVKFKINSDQLRIYYNDGSNSVTLEKQ